ncbi:peptidoglycan DD-metalloendopeptidase family protein [Alistipes putredinis]|uniref:peptidoglycan DD-metalloendopeptidase family protein n=1 Tax=Alistipes putredinis TaxID=28117 RepID=UPI003F5D2057
MKNRHIIAAALLLLTTTAAAQDRHTETAPDTGENLQTAPNAEQLRQQIETLQRQLDLLEKGRDTLAAKKPALLSDPVEPIANMNGIIPLDTLQTINEAVKIVIYNDNSWKYVRDREFVKDSSIYTKYWDTGTLFPYKEYPLSEMPASLAIDLVDSLKCYHYPHKGSIRSKYGIRHRRRHQGVDIPIKTGDPVYATFNGRVRISEYNRGGYGNLIIVRHDNGLETYYGHLSERLVQSGEWVEAGQIIGLGGSTGRSTGPHLHFETRYYGQAFDPERLIDFESGILRRQTFLLKKSFFDIRSNAGQDFDDEAEVEKADKKEAAERAAVTYHTIKSGDTLGALARRYGTTVRHDGIEALFAQRYQIDHDPAARTQAPGPLNKQTSRNRAGCGMKLAPYRMMRLRKQIIK